MFEAMLLRKPIICFDTSGMSVVVNSETGCMIPVCKYESAVKQFAAQMENCDDALCQKKGHLAYQRVITRFTWKAKVEQMNDRLCEIDSNTTEQFNVYHRLAIWALRIHELLLNKRVR